MRSPRSSTRGDASKRPPGAGIKTEFDASTSSLQIHNALSRSLNPTEVPQPGGNLDNVRRHRSPPRPPIYIPYPVYVPVGPSGIQYPPPRFPTIPGNRERDFRHDFPDRFQHRERSPPRRLAYPEYERYPQMPEEYRLRSPDLRPPYDERYFRARSPIRRQSPRREVLALRRSRSPDTHRLNRSYDENVFRAPSPSRREYSPRYSPGGLPLPTRQGSLDLRPSSWGYDERDFQSLAQVRRRLPPRFDARNEFFPPPPRYHSRERHPSYPNYDTDERHFRSRSTERYPRPSPRSWRSPSYRGLVDAEYQRECR